MVREYLHPLVEADKCAVYVDDNCIAGHSVGEVTTNNESVSSKKNTQDSSFLRLNVLLVTLKRNFLVEALPPKVLAPLKTRLKKILKVIKFPTVHWLRTVLQAVHTESSRHTCALE